MDNSAQRLHRVFFYGLYMDPEILKQKSVEPRSPQIAYAVDFELRIGDKATLLRAAGKIAHGIVYALTHDEIERLYRGSGLTEYAAEAITVVSEGEEYAALCCNLVRPPATNESNPDYREKLVAAMERLGVATTAVEQAG